MEHSITIRVRYPEVDAMGYLHHSRYLQYLEMGRIELLRSMGHSYVDFEKAGFKKKQTGWINQITAFFLVLLSLAVIVSLFGIVNTLVLAIYERTRELGLLRAVGMSKRQVRRIVRYESVITALIGAILGTVLGVFFAVIISRPLAGEGFKLSFPVGTLVILLILAGLAGVLAAITPARRASKLNVLEALAYE